MPFLTATGENKLAQNQSVSGGLNIVSFVLANVPNLGAEPSDRISALPNPSLIVDTLPFTKRGYVNPNQVVYSLVMGSNLGDYDFNWIGLIDDDGVLVAVSHIPTIQKRKNVGGIPGNTITRNFLLKYTGIQNITATTVPVETWQIDFGTRLTGIDERERLSNLDTYGHEGFLGDGWKVTGSAGTYSVAAGIGYVGGVRAKNTAPQEITTATFPNEIWLNVSLQGDISDMTAVCEFVIDTGPFEDYVDGNGIEHYLTKIATIASNGTATPTRVIYKNLEDHEAKYDPHPQYHDASLLNKGVVPYEQIPAGSISRGMGFLYREPNAENKVIKIAELTDLIPYSQTEVSFIIGPIGNYGSPNRTYHFVSLANRGESVSCNIANLLPSTDSYEYYVDVTTSAVTLYVALPSFNGCLEIKRISHTGQKSDVFMTDVTGIDVSGMTRYQSSLGVNAPATASEIISGISNSLKVTPLGLADAGFACLTGSIQYFISNTAPLGFVKANGAELSRTTYANLFLFAQSSGGGLHKEGSQLVGQFGDGDGATTFTVPNLQGYVLRVLDESGEIDSDGVRGIGSVQNDAIRDITGTIRVSANDSSTVSGAFTKVSLNSGANLDGNNDYTYTANFAASNVVPTASENRMKNIAYPAYIKY